MRQPAASVEAASSSSDGEARVFEQAGWRVLRRILLRRALAGFLRGFWPLLLVLACLAIWAACGGGRVVALIAPTLLATFLIFTGLLIWRKRPSLFAALSLWDRETGRREAFAAAWWFEGLPGRSEAETAHYLAQREKLPEALYYLSKDLPLPRWHRLTALPALCLLAAWGGWQAERRTRGPELTAAMIETASAQARVVAALEKQAEAMAALTKEEQERLRQQMREAAEVLENSAGKTARELLDALESKARALEKLAQRLAAQGELWASPELTEALRRQADTADLGDAVADRNAAAAGAAADTLASKIDDAEGGQLERLDEVFQTVRQAAQAEDRGQPVGAAVLEGAEALQAGEASTAARAMRELARQMRDLASQRQTRQAMEQLAQQLRDAGSQVAATDSGQTITAMSTQGETAEQSQSNQGADGTLEEQRKNPGDSPNQSAREMAMAGAQGQSGESTDSTRQGQLGEALPAMPGERRAGVGRGVEKPEQATPMLFAPVPPGSAAEEKPPEMAVILPGGSGGGRTAGAGNALPPGTGTAEFNPGESSDPVSSSRQALVNAQSSREGTSTLRQVDGGLPDQNEAAQRDTVSLTAAYLEAQEAALEEAVLPPTRREQVRRYFNALRQRLEGRDGTTIHQHEN